MMFMTRREPDMADFTIKVQGPGLYPVAQISQTTDRLLVFTKAQGRKLIGELASALENLPDD